MRIGVLAATFGQVPISALPQYSPLAIYHAFTLTMSPRNQLDPVLLDLFLLFLNYLLTWGEGCSH